MSSFLSLGVSEELVCGLRELGIEEPTEVQRKTIPMLQESDRDLVVQAQTGTGKTAAFGLPLLMRIKSDSPKIQGLVLAPTRELAKQIAKQLFRFTKHCAAKVFTEVVSGGEPMEKQVAGLKRPTQVLVATPGRLVELLKQKAVDLSGVRYLVLDEADEMLSMGFRKEIHEILKQVGARKGTWLFSATFPESIQELVKHCMEDTPRKLTIDRAHRVNRDIDHCYLLCTRDQKAETIASFLHRCGEDRGMVFCRTKAGAITLGRLLTDEGFAVDVLQGDLTQKERDKVMRSFKKARTRVLVATDVAARGIDIEALEFVIHHQIPDQMEYYTHRSGRTARAGRKGLSVVLIDPRERKRLEGLERELGVYFREY